LHWLIDLIKIVAVLAAAGILGSWFLREVRRTKLSGKPWYTPYISPPGLLIFLALLLPVLAWIVHQ